MGFEVINLDEFVKKRVDLGIVVDIPPQKMPDAGIKVAYLTDPWGTRIELTEGLGPAAKPRTSRR